MNNSLYTQVWGEEPPKGTQTNVSPLAGRDVVAGLELDLAELRAAKALLSDLADRLGVIETNLERALATLRSPAPKHREPKPKVVKTPDPTGIRYSHPRIPKAAKLPPVGTTETEGL